MKRLIFVLVFVFGIAYFSNHVVFANEEVQLSQCVDGDTAHFMVAGKAEKVRFIGINAPEYTKEQEAYGKEASTYVCDALKHANRITLEYEESAPRDKYGRLLAWVFVDGELLQEQLVEKGLAEVKYIYDDYKYTDILYEKEAIAKQQQRNMWSDEEYDNTNYLYILFLIVAFLFILFFSKKGKRSKLRKITKMLKK